MSGTNRLGFPLFLVWLLCWTEFTSAAFLRNPNSQQPLRLENDGQQPLPTKPRPSPSLPALLDALDVLQEGYFSNWLGVWPTSIDWTSAVIGTYLSSALMTLSSSFDSLPSSKAAENIVNKYYSQLVASYFGQDAFALRQEAYDDMLWVVLGWLESIKFVKMHSALHYGEIPGVEDSKWYGHLWIPAFAHRARIFWELASQGWDTSLCSGGMIWSPYLVPYKNAITNELYIAASISMYLYFPGDDNASPFGFSAPPTMVTAEEYSRPHDPKYLAAAIEAYKWLNDSNMTDSKGLFVDGYHISGWSRERSKNESANRRCDERNEMVYTYNQGVLLSGQRGLYEATGARSYLEDGHGLVSDVIAATGWDVRRDRVVEEGDADKPRNRLGKWHGLGRSGILEEACDAPGYCSQDAQTFKGIFFHHLTLFCAELPDHLVLPGGTFLNKYVQDVPESPAVVNKWHKEQCCGYGSWIKHNAQGALSTLDDEGRFGMWWGAPAHSSSEPDAEVDLPEEAVDYRNLGVPSGWKEKRQRRETQQASGEFNESKHGIGITDLNDRGRGRTVETQGGGVAVLRALWEMVESN